MTTIRISERPRYTAISRETLNDSRLSFRARGVLAWLLDKPDDWKCRAEAIAEAGCEGRDAIRAALGELEACGYLVRIKYRAPAGHWESTVDVYERPRETPGQNQDGKPALVSRSRETSAGSPGPLTKTEPNTETNPPTPHNDIERIAQRVGVGVTDLRQERGLGVAGAKAIEVVVKQVDVELLDYWLRAGHPESEIVRCMISRIADGSTATPTEYFAPPERVDEPSIERVREILGR